MGSIIAAPFYRDYARRYSGTGQYDWLANPVNMNDTVGAVSFWFYVPVLLTGNGLYPIYCLSDSGPKVGTFGRSIAIGIRRNTAYGNTNNYLDVTFIGSGSSVFVKSNSTPISAAGWYHGVVTSDAEIYLNAATPAYTAKWSANNWVGGQWFGSVGGTDKDLALGAARLSGTVGSYGRIDLNEVIYLNAVPTSTEVAELYGGGSIPNPASFSLGLRNKISVYRGFEKTLVPIIGSGTLTAVGSPTYIAFP